MWQPRCDPQRFLDGRCDPAIALETGLKVELAAALSLLIFLKLFFLRSAHNDNDCNALFEALMRIIRAQLPRVTSPVKALILIVQLNGARSLASVSPQRNPLSVFHSISKFFLDKDPFLVPVHAAAQPCHRSATDR